MDHALARRQATEGFKLKFGREPTLREVQFLQAIGMLETSYGKGWAKTGAVGSNNMGAIIAGGSWKGATFTHKDSLPQSDGSNQWYTTEFRKYPTPAEGWQDLANIMYEDRPGVLAAAQNGDAFQVSAEMYHSKYYFGFGPDAKTRIGNHYAKLLKCLIVQCRALHENLPDSRTPHGTLKRGDTGEEVKELQRIFELATDGIFGPVVESAVKLFQEEHGLKADGIVGPRTWEALEDVFSKATPVPVEVDEAEDELVAQLSSLRESARTLRVQLDDFLKDTV